MQGDITLGKDQAHWRGNVDTPAGFRQMATWLTLAIGTGIRETCEPTTSNILLRACALGLLLQDFLPCCYLFSA